MANHHFGALGDVWKHLLLAEILRLNPPRHYWETHAGSAAYPLGESPTRAHGALRFLQHAPNYPELASCSYLESLRAFPGSYPGSPQIAMHLLRRTASYVFCDTDPESVESLRRAGDELNVRALQADGVASIKLEAATSDVPPPEVLVHIDPFDPHERRSPHGLTPIELAASLATAGYRIFYWYGYDSADERGWAANEIGRLAPTVDLWCGEIAVPSPFVYPDRTGEWGCGVVLANVTDTERAACEMLGAALERMADDDVLPRNDPPRLGFRVVL